MNATKGWILANAALLGAANAAVAATAEEWLSLGNQQWAPTVTSKSGIGTANAVAEAKVTRKELEGWCANWSPGDKDCVARELANPDTKRTYRASADCTQGKITPVDGEAYTLAGTWDKSDIGAGRTRWRDAAGKIVGRDNASGGLAISQQWELLCPGPFKGQPAGKSVAAAPAAAAAARPDARASGAAVAPAAAAQYAVGQAIEAKYGGGWVRGRVAQIRQTTGAAGPELGYDVRLENGMRGVLPARMLRAASAP